MSNLNVGDRIAFERPDGAHVFITACKAYVVESVLPEGIFTIRDDRGQRLACGISGASELTMEMMHNTWKEWKGYLVRGVGQAARLNLPIPCPMISRMEDVPAIAMNHDAGRCISLGMAVAASMRTFIQQNDLMAFLRKMPGNQ